MVCRSVYPLVTNVNSGKTAEAIEMPFRVMGRVGTRYHVVDAGPAPPREGANFLREKGRRNVGRMWLRRCGLFPIWGVDFLSTSSCYFAGPSRQLYNQSGQTSTGFSSHNGDVALMQQRHQNGGWDVDFRGYAPMLSGTLPLRMRGGTLDEASSLSTRSSPIRRPTKTASTDFAVVCQLSSGGMLAWLSGVRCRLA